MCFCPWTTALRQTRSILNLMHTRKGQIVNVLCQALRLKSWVSNYAVSNNQTWCMMASMIRRGKYYNQIEQVLWSNWAISAVAAAMRVNAQDRALPEKNWTDILPSLSTWAGYTLSLSGCDLACMHPKALSSSISAWLMLWCTCWQEFKLIITCTIRLDPVSHPKSKKHKQNWPGRGASCTQLMLSSHKLHSLITMTAQACV